MQKEMIQNLQYLRQTDELEKEEKSEKELPMRESFNVTENKPKGTTHDRNNSTDRRNQPNNIG